MAVSFVRAHPTTSRRIALGMLLLVAFVLRVWNLDWDEGTHQHPDERYWSIVTNDISAAGPLEYFDSATSPLNPYNSGTPEAPRTTWVYGTFPLFSTKAVASFLADGPFPAGAIVTVADNLGIDLRNDRVEPDGSVTRVDAFNGGYDANLVGRLLSALIDTATVVMAYLLARDLFDRRTGMIAATLVAFAPLHIQYAHFYGAEPWVTFFVTTGVWLSLRLARGNLSPRLAAGIGVVMGLGLASKLIAAAALVVPAVAVLVATGPAIAALARQVWSRIESEAADNRAGLVALAGAVVVGAAAAALVVGLRAAVILAVLAAAGAAVVYALAVVRPATGTTEQASVLFDQLADPQQIVIERPKAHPPLHVVAWGAFTGIIVVVAAAVTYRWFQPYSFDGLISRDQRFVDDIAYLENVNSGGNVPWVVQWIGRTPLLFPLQSAFWWGMGPALGLAVAYGTVKAVLDVVRRERWILLVPLSFLAIMIGLVSQQFNPLIRYLLPAYPVAIVLGAFGVASLWNAGRAAAARTGTRSRAIGHALRVTAVGLVVLTAFWGLAFVNGVHNQTHPRIDASVWMAENLPQGAVLSSQLWDDSLPLRVGGTEGFEFRHVTLDPFQADRAGGKVDQLIAGLDEVDYVVEASNRIYDSVTRIPAKYPATNAYYDALFDGRLGFTPIAQFRNAPSLFGIDLPDHFAEETFTVYDHPTVTIWQKTDQWSVERATAILNPAKAATAPDVVPRDAATNALLLAPDDDALVEQGQTFDEAFSDSGPIGSVPWLFWLLWLQLAAFAVLPWTTLAFGRLPDAGYGLTKLIGFATIGLGVWLSVSWNVVDFGRGVSWTWFALVVIVGLALWARHGDRMATLARTHRRAWLWTEAVFLGVFALTLWLRSANPDLWEAYLGGEKPMEMAYLTAIARSGDFPAVDPWFAGGFMNYYYLGWFLLTVPMRALRVLPEVAFNLGVATYAALTAAVAFSVVHNLVAVSRRRWATTAHDTSRAPVRAGLLGVILLMGIGNLDALRLHYDRLEDVNTWDAGPLPGVSHVITFLGGSWAWATGTPLERFDWWQPSRVNRGNFDITEFPYFTFLFGDVHPHMMGMAFVGLTVSIAFAYLLVSDAGDRRLPLVLAIGLGVTTGYARAVNTWDLPSLMILTGAAIAVGAWLVPDPGTLGPRARGAAITVGTLGIALGASNWGGPGATALLACLGIGVVALATLALPASASRRVVRGVGHLIAAGIAHVVVFHPYLSNNDPIETGLQRAVAGSPLDDFVTHWGIFVAIGTAFAAALALDMGRRRRMGDQTRPMPALVWDDARWKAVWVAGAVVAAAVMARFATTAAAISLLGVLVFGLFLIHEVRRAERDVGRIVAIGLFTLAFAIAGGVDVVTVRNDIERMNTVFKFWLQSWQYFALASAFAVWQVGRILGERPSATAVAGGGATVGMEAAGPGQRRTWGVVVLVLVGAGLAYPLLGTRTRIETRFADLPATLDGLAYLEADPVIVRPDPRGGDQDIQVFLADDLPLIDWMRANVRGTPVVAEWAGSAYDWNARFTVHTGMPTVLGWDWHQKQQRWTYQSMVDERLAAVTAFYTNPDPTVATRFLQAYDVSYVIVGTQEHRFGSPEAIAALAEHPALDEVFSSGRYRIYRVDRAALWPGVDATAFDDLLALPD